MNDDAIPLERRSLDRLAAVAATLIDVDIVVISVLDDHFQQALGSHGLEPGALAGESTCSLCRSVALSVRPIIVQHTPSRPPLTERTGWGRSFMAYAGMPMPRTGGVVGTMAAMSATRRSWQQRDLDVLRALADTAGAVIEMWRRTCSPPAS